MPVAAAASRSAGQLCTSIRASRLPPPPHSFITVNLGLLPIVRGDDRLRLLDHQVIRDVVHVGQLPWAAAVVAAIGVGRGGAPLEQLGHLAIANRPAGEAARGRLKIAGPTVAGHPDFDLHVGVAGTLDRTGDAAERRADP